MMTGRDTAQTAKNGGAEAAKPAFDCVSGLLKKIDADKAYEIMMRAEAEYQQNSN